MRADADTPQESRFAGAFIVLGLSLAVVGILYLVWMQRVQELAPLQFDPAGRPIDDAPAPASRPMALMSALVYTFVIFLAFLVGSFLMVRVGRYLVDRNAPPRRSEYVDAWGSYRITEAEIDAALADDPGAQDEPPAAPPAPT